MPVHSRSLFCYLRAAAFSQSKHSLMEIISLNLTFKYPTAGIQVYLSKGLGRIPTRWPYDLGMIYIRT